MPWGMSSFPTLKLMSRVRSSSKYFEVISMTTNIGIRGEFGKYFLVFLRNILRIGRNSVDLGDERTTHGS